MGLESGRPLRVEFLPRIMGELLLREPLGLAGKLLVNLLVTLLDRRELLV